MARALIALSAFGIAIAANQVQAAPHGGGGHAGGAHIGATHVGGTNFGAAHVGPTHFGPTFNGPSAFHQHVGPNNFGSYNHVGNTNVGNFGHIGNTNVGNFGRIGNTNVGNSNFGHIGNTNIANNAHVHVGPTNLNFGAAHYGPTTRVGPAPSLSTFRGGAFAAAGSTGLHAGFGTAGAVSNRSSLSVNQSSTVNKFSAARSTNIAASTSIYRNGGFPYTGRASALSGTGSVRPIVVRATVNSTSLTNNTVNNFNRVPAYRYYGGGFGTGFGAGLGLGLAAPIGGLYSFPFFGASYGYGYPAYGYGGYGGFGAPGYGFGSVYPASGFDNGIPFAADDIPPAPLNGDPNQPTPSVDPQQPVVQNGLKIVDVAKDSIAQASDLRPGDVILGVGQTRTQNFEELRAALQAAQGKEMDLIFLNSENGKVERMPLTTPDGRIGVSVVPVGLK